MRVGVRTRESGVRKCSTNTIEIQNAKAKKDKNWKLIYKLIRLTAYFYFVVVAVVVEALLSIPNLMLEAAGGGCLSFLSAMLLPCLLRPGAIF